MGYIEQSILRGEKWALIESKDSKFAQELKENIVMTNDLERYNFFKDNPTALNKYTEYCKSNKMNSMDDTISTYNKVVEEFKPKVKKVK